MFTLGTRSASSAALALPCLAALLSCGAPAPSASDGDAAVGTLSMPLATIVNDVRYRLAPSRFSLSGPVEIGLLQENGNGTILVATLPEGDYEVTLHDGWVLQRQMESGFEAVVAELASPNPRPLRIVSGQTTMLAWLFRTDGVPVDLGPPGVFQGNLAVSDSSNPATRILGDVLAQTAEQVDVLGGLETIQGSLTVQGDVSSLAALSALTQIDGDLTIDATALTSLAGLEALTEVGGRVIITNNAALPTCAAEALVGALGSEPADVEISDNDDTGVCP